MHNGDVSRVGVKAHATGLFATSKALKQQIRELLHDKKELTGQLNSMMVKFQEDQNAIEKQIDNASAILDKHRGSEDEDDYSKKEHTVFTSLSIAVANQSELVKQIVGAYQDGFRDGANHEAALANKIASEMMATEQQFSSNPTSPRNSPTLMETNPPSMLAQEKAAFMQREYPASSFPPPYNVAATPSAPPVTTAAYPPAYSQSPVTQHPMMQQIPYGNMAYGAVPSAIIPGMVQAMQGMAYSMNHGTPGGFIQTTAFAPAQPQIVNQYVTHMTPQVAPVVAPPPPPQASIADFFGPKNTTGQNAFQQLKAQQEAERLSHLQASLAAGSLLMGGIKQKMDDEEQKLQELERQCLAAHNQRISFVRAFLHDQQNARGAVLTAMRNKPAQAFATMMPFPKNMDEAKALMKITDTNYCRVHDSLVDKWDGAVNSIHAMNKMVSFGTKKSYDSIDFEKEFKDILDYNDFCKGGRYTTTPHLKIFFETSVDTNLSEEVEADTPYPKKKEVAQAAPAVSAPKVMKAVRKVEVEKTTLPPAAPANVSSDEDEGLPILPFRNFRGVAFQKPENYGDIKSNLERNGIHLPFSDAYVLGINHNGHLVSISKSEMNNMVTQALMVLKAGTTPGKAPKQAVTTLDRENPNHMAVFEDILKRTYELSSLIEDFSELKAYA